jgi:hypothetical protein
MLKKTNILLFILVMLVVNSINIFAQAQVDISLSGSDGTSNIALNVGLDPTATTGIDPSLGESDLPPFPPAGVFEIRFDLFEYAGSNLSSYQDYRNAAFPFTGTVQHTLWWQTSAPGLAINLTYNLPAGTEFRIQDIAGGSFLNIGPFSGSGVATIPASYTGIFQRALFFMDYTNVSPSLPILSISPVSPLSLPAAVVGGTPSNADFTVSNTGATTLAISNITSSNSEFTFSPNSFPVSVAPGGNQVFTVTFTPTSTGNKTSDLVITHNAAGSPTTYVVNGQGVAPSPLFSVSPASLNFGPVVLGSPSVLPVTVSNTGTLQLDISNITSDNAQFTFSPNTFPISIAPGANQVINVTFDPTSLGPQSGTLVFTHNAVGSPSNYSVQGTGAEAVAFSVNPSSLDFGTVNQPNSSTLNVTVTNTGASTALSISSASTSAPFSVTPSSANILPGGTQVFQVTFTPTSGGTFNNDLTFIHNAAGSPSVVSLTGNSPSISGLIFKLEEQTRREDSVYVDTLTLRNVNVTAGPIQALQFKLLVNGAEAGEDTVIKFISLTKGSDIATSNWVLDYNYIPGGASLGATVDTIYAVLYNINAVGGLGLTDYSDLLRVTYRIVDLPLTKDSAFSRFRLLNAFASTANGTAIDVTPLPSDLRINVWNRVSANSLGDVNGDGTIDILDLINVVDHIVSRDSLEKTITPGLTTSEFERANIAPWNNIDAFVNVQDLALIQQIILEGQYPNGNPINKPVLLAGSSDKTLSKSNGVATVKLYITEEGIAVKLASDIGIRGAQLEFSSLESNVGNLIIDSRLGGGFYNQINDFLIVLLYDQSGNAVVEAGESLVANIPFPIEDPRSIKIDEIILVDINKAKIGQLNVEIIYSNAPEIPVDYSLSQNYPNPFNPNTTVRFSVPKEGYVTIKVYDMIGQEITTLYSGNAQRGTYIINWNGKHSNGNQVSSGSYIYKMTAGDFVQAKKMLLIK